MNKIGYDQTDKKIIVDIYGLEFEIKGLDKNKVEEIKKIFPKSKIILRTVSSKTNDGIPELLLDIISMAQMKVKKLFVGEDVNDGFELVSEDVVERLKERKPIQKSNSFFSKFINFDF